MTRLTKRRRMTDAEMDRHIRYCEEVGDANKLHNSQWSISEVSDFEAEHPFGKRTVLLYDSHPGWGEPSGEFKADIKGKRWLDLWIAADEILGACGDKHHVFIEVFEDAGPGKLRFLCGS